jgi:hypothetical protein
VKNARRVIRSALFARATLFGRPFFRACTVIPVELKATATLAASPPEVDVMTATPGVALLAVIEARLPVVVADAALSVAVPTAAVKLTTVPSGTGEVKDVVIVEAVVPSAAREDGSR